MDKMTIECPTLNLQKLKRKKHARIQAPIALERSISLTSSEVVDPKMMFNVLVGNE